MKLASLLIEQVSSQVSFLPRKFLRILAFLDLPWIQLILVYGDQTKNKIPTILKIIIFIIIT